MQEYDLYQGILAELQKVFILPFTQPGKINNWTFSLISKKNDKKLTRYCMRKLYLHLDSDLWEMNKPNGFKHKGNAFGKAIIIRHEIG